MGALRLRRRAGARWSESALAVEARVRDGGFTPSGPCCLDWSIAGNSIRGVDGRAIDPHVLGATCRVRGNWTRDYRHGITMTFQLGIVGLDSTVTGTARHSDPEGAERSPTRGT